MEKVANDRQQRVEVREYPIPRRGTRKNKPRKDLAASQEALNTFHQALKILGISWYGLEKSLAVTEYKTVWYWKTGRAIPNSFYYGKVLRLVLEKFAPSQMNEEGAPEVQGKEKKKRRRVVSYQGQRSFEDFEEVLSGLSTSEE